jgi:integrase
VSTEPEILPTGISRRGAGYFARVKLDGKETSHSFPTVAEAVAWRDGELRRRGAGHLTSNAGALAGHANLIMGKMERGALANRHGERYDPSVLRRYRSWLERVWLPALGAHPVNRIQARDIKAILDELGMKHAGSTVRDALKPMQVIYRELKLDGVVNENPAIGLRLPPKSSRRKRILDPADPLGVVGLVEARQRIALLSGRERVFWAIAFYAGLRAGEIRGLDWGDVDEKRGEIHVRRQIVTNEHAAKLPKGGKVRSVPILEPLRAELALWALEQDRRRQGLVVSTRGVTFTYSDVVDKTRKAWDAAKLRWVTPHEARHTFVSMLAAAGVASDEARAWSGHSDEEMRLLYTHLMPDATNRARAAVEAYLSRHG